MYLPDLQGLDLDNKKTTTKKQILPADALPVWRPTVLNRNFSRSNHFSLVIFVNSSSVNEFFEKLVNFRFFTFHFLNHFSTKHHATTLDQWAVTSNSKWTNQISASAKHKQGLVQFGLVSPIQPLVSPCVPRRFSLRKYQD